MPETAKSGTIITDDLAEQLADEAEHGYDLHPGRGRPSLTGVARESPQVTFRIPPELREQARVRAQREGTTVSALARQALEHYLAS